MFRLLLLTLVACASCHTSALADPGPIDAPPTEGGSDAVVAAGVVFTGASFVFAIHNGRMALHGKPGLASSLVAVAVGVGALSAAASNETPLEAFGVVAGMGAVLTGAARLAQHHHAHRVQQESGAARAARRPFQVEPSPYGLGLCVRF